MASWLPAPVGKISRAGTVSAPPLHVRKTGWKSDAWALPRTGQPAMFSAAPWGSSQHWTSDRRWPSLLRRLFSIMISPTMRHPEVLFQVTPGSRLYWVSVRLSGTSMMWECGGRGRCQLSKLGHLKWFLPEEYDQAA